MPDALQAAQLQAIDTVDRLTRSFGGQAWLRGGWAMDFCLGHVTRSHTDVDIFIDEVVHRRTVDALIAQGWVLDDRLPVERQADLSRDGVELSLNPVRQVEGVAVHGPGPWEGEPFPGDMLEHAGRTTVQGVEASHISPMAQIEFKLMTPVWRPDLGVRTKDEADVALLCQHMLAGHRHRPDRHEARSTSPGHLHRIGTPTGWVVAARDVDRASHLWHGGLGFAEPTTSPAGLPVWEHPDTGQRITVAGFDEPDPAVALGVRCDDLDHSLQSIDRFGLTEYWRDTSADGTRFVMCQGEPGVFLLLYQQPEQNPPAR